ncbi:hypothetical protein OG453_26415 [Streptomyces sp. NBC_01381]|uniref:hypothetical protein n=1 Tax=Streptomyces sp. NBC_01381 TaxID=2903845 RepID=UPI0022583C2B|nr:hypothetical protein [Streptomyces sp. NBC_01381]MCX4670185.1 hypothetical protein [Streptomyces sp. NBC_01381]
MGTKTEDETAAEAAAKPEADEAVDAVKVEKSTASEEAGEVVDDADDADELDMADEADEAAPAKSSGVFTGAAAVVSAALGVIGLSGGWLGTVAAARSNIVGQLETKQSASVADQIQALYGDSWQVTALIAGAFALAALVVGFVVLVRPAFGAPDQEQAPWIKSVAWAGVTLGVIGLLLAIAKYSDLIYGLPSAS